MLLLIAVVPLVANATFAAIEFESNAPQANNDLIVYREAAESHMCWGGSAKQTRAEAEPAGAANNVWSVPPGQGCDIIWLPQQDATLHLHIRLRVEDNAGAPVTPMHMQILYARNPAQANTFWGSYLPQNSAIVWPTDTSQANADPFVILDLTIYSGFDFRTYDGATPQIRIWNQAANNENFILDSFYFSTTQ